MFSTLSYFAWAAHSVCVPLNVDVLTALERTRPATRLPDINHALEQRGVRVQFEARFWMGVALHNGLVKPYRLKAHWLRCHPTIRTRQATHKSNTGMNIALASHSNRLLL